jgi:hypothetical protein
MGSKNELPGMEGPGVEVLEIDAIDKAIAKYQRKKKARCEVSPDELVAKRELREILHKHRDKLPVTKEGVPFYRSEGRDYILQEKLTIEKVPDASEDNE